MNGMDRPNNPEAEHPFDEQQLGFFPHRTSRSTSSKTSELQGINYGSSTQVNMDEEFPRDDHSKQRKREKKKEYKRKKKEKLREEERSAKIHLAEVIDLIYKRETTFEECQVQIQDCLYMLLGGDKFHSFLNQAIRIHVNNVQKEIWDFMQEIIHENPFEKPDEDQDFYLIMVDKIYEEYEKLHQSSREIQKIINLFMRISETTDQSECQNLDRSTFNYLIESDETIKNLIRICERRISIRHVRQVNELKEIGSMMNEDDYDDYYEEYITEKSTSVEDEEQEDKHNKKKKKKLKQADYSNSEEEVIRRLNEMVIIDESRLNCLANDTWLQRIAHHRVP